MSEQQMDAPVLLHRMASRHGIVVVSPEVLRGMLDHVRYVVDKWRDMLDARKGIGVPADWDGTNGTPPLASKEDEEGFWASMEAELQVGANSLRSVLDAIGARLER